MTIFRLNNASKHLVVRLPPDHLAALTVEPWRCCPVEYI